MPNYKIKRYSDNEVFEVGDDYDGGKMGITDAGLGKCPIVFYPQSVVMEDDSLGVNISKAISDKFFVFDADETPSNTDINPNVSAVPIINIVPLKAYSGLNNDTLFSLTIENSEAWALEFCTNRVGTVDGIGFPLTFVQISKNSEGRFNVLTATNGDYIQAIYIRFKKSSGENVERTYVKFEFWSMPEYMDTGGGGGGGGGGVGSVNAVAAFNNVPLLMSMWPMFGNDQPNVFQQGTYQDDIKAMELLAKTTYVGSVAYNRLPWFAQRNNTPTAYQTSIWQNGVDTGQKETSLLDHSFLLTTEVMNQMLEYAVQAGVQGFMVLNYADDGYLSLFRRLFRVHSNKRGLKACWSLGFGGGGRDTYDSDLANGVNSPYIQTINSFAQDIMQPWYAKAIKNGVAVPIVYALQDNYNAQIQADTITRAWEDLSRIKARVIVNGGVLTDTFNVLMTSGPDVTASGADAAGHQWNATTSYYLQPQVSFSNAGAMLDNNLNKESLASTVPMVSWGYNSDARWYYHWQTIPGNSFAYDSVLSYMPTLLEKLKAGMAANKDMRLALVGVEGEYMEQGQGVFPNIYGDRRMLDIFRAKFYPGYTLPT